MSDWMLYHVWGMIRGYQVSRCERVDSERVLVTIAALPQVVCCPRCGTKDVVRKGANPRLWLGTPVGRQKVYFEAQVPRVHCAKCGITRQVSALATIRYNGAISIEGKGVSDVMLTPSPEGTLFETMRACFRASGLTQPDVGC